MKVSSSKRISQSYFRNLEAAAWTKIQKSRRSRKSALRLLGLVITFLGLADGVESQQPKKVYRIGYLSTLAPEISGKQIEILKEVVPRISRVAVLGNSTRSATSLSFKEMERAAGVLKVQLQYLDIRDAKDIETAFGAASKGRADAIVVLGSPVLNLRRTQIADLAVKNRMPGVYAQPEFIDAGGLMYYGASFTDIFQRAATYVDKIFKGAKPADLPIEQPIKFEFVVNLKAAKQIGLTIPPNVLVRADRVIK